MKIMETMIDAMIEPMEMRRQEIIRSWGEVVKYESLQQYAWIYLKIRQAVAVKTVLIKVPEDEVMVRYNDTNMMTKDGSVFMVTVQTDKNLYVGGSDALDNQDDEMGKAIVEILQDFEGNSEMLTEEMDAMMHIISLMCPTAFLPNIKEGE